MDGPSVNVGVVVCTFDRINDARCCLEILRSAWQPDPFPLLHVVHAYNGAPHWYTASLEDQLIQLKPAASHYVGAAELLDAGLLTLAQQPVDYAVAMAGDVWAYDAHWVDAVISEMATHRLRLATADWRIDAEAHGLRRAAAPTLLPMDGLATDFFIVDLPWAIQNNMLPLRYGEFLNRHDDLLNYFQEMPFLERYLAGRFLGAVRQELRRQPGKDAWGSAGPRTARQLLRILDERPIDPQGLTAPAHEGHWPHIGLITTHDPQQKKAVAADHANLFGPTLRRLAASDDLAWYSAPART